MNRLFRLPIMITVLCAVFSTVVFATNWNSEIISADQTITISEDMTITGTIVIDSGATVTVKSEESNLYTLTRGTNEELFNVESGGTLVLENIIIDGDKDTYDTNITSLVIVYGVFEMKDGAVLQNNRANFGGGVTVSRNGTVTMSDSSIRENEALSGGGVFISSGGIDTSFTMESGSISGNKVTGSGGGIYIFAQYSGSAVAFVMKDGIIEKNEAAFSGGGGVYICASLGAEVNFTMENGEICNNTGVYISGGGVYLFAHGNGGKATFTICDGSISENTAGGGGGVYVTATYGGETEFTMKSGEISRNKTSFYGSGGGVYVDAIFNSSSAKFTMEGGIISKNETANGGGVFISTFDNGSLASFIMKDGEISKNNANSNGGGVYLWDNNGGRSEFAMMGGEISENESNQGGGVFTFSNPDGDVEFKMMSGVIKNNVANTHGGGVYIGAVGISNFIMENGLISNNIANEDGGAVYVCYNAKFSLKNGILNKNKATRGGGVYVYADNDTKAEFSMEDGTISGNTADYGGGVWWSELLTFTIPPQILGSLYDNCATKGFYFMDDGLKEKHNSIFGIENTYTNGYDYVLNNNDVYCTGATNNKSSYFWISFELNGGNGVSNRWAKDGELITSFDSSSTIPTRYGYTFIGWYTDEDLRNTFNVNTGLVTSNLTLYASWNKNPSVQQITPPSSKDKDNKPTTWTDSGSNGSIATYTVTFDTNGGSVVNSQSVQSDGYVIRPDNPTREGFTFTEWFSDKELAKEYDFSKGVMGNITIYAKWAEDMPTPDPTKWKNLFTDVKKGDWFYDDVEYAATYGLFNGTSATTFSPNTPMTRAMLVTVLWRMAGSLEERIPEAVGGGQFSDVAEGTYCYQAVNWAVANGIVNGTGNGLFAPDAEIARQDMAVMLMRYLVSINYEYVVTEEYRIFTDEDYISDYAKNAVQVLNKLGIINGKGDNIIDPQGTATRAEVAAMLHRLLVVS